MHMIRQQAAIDLQHNTEDGAYITEQQIDNYVIANHEAEEGEMQRTLSVQQKYDATLQTAREANAKEGFYRNETRTWPKPVPVRTPPEQHNWDFFYRSIQAAPDTSVNCAVVIPISSLIDCITVSCSTIKAALNPRGLYVIRFLVPAHRAVHSKHA